MVIGFGMFARHLQQLSISKLKMREPVQVPLVYFFIHKRYTVASVIFRARIMRPRSARSAYRI